jgi:hypothetical protein
MGRGELKPDNRKKQLISSKKLADLNIIGKEPITTPYA